MFLPALFVFLLDLSLLAESRETVKFDFAWRFHLGDIPVEKCYNGAFPTNRSGMQCTGLHRQGDLTDAEHCRDACCEDESCGVWQFAEPSWDPLRGCWTGVSDECTKNDLWVGGGRSTPAPPVPPATTGPTSRGYNDSDWEIVDVPHDGIIGGTYSHDADSGHGYLPYNVTWYRKHFSLPQDWHGSAIWLYFEGVFHHTSVYLNGEKLTYHDSGYTSFYVRIDNATDIAYGNGSGDANVIAVRAEAGGGSGWWYEGGGIYRHVWLVRSSPLHLVPDGLYAAPNVTQLENDQSHEPVLQGMATISPWAEVVQDGLVTATARVTFLVLNEQNETVAKSTSTNVTISKNEVVQVSVPAVNFTAELWTPHRPYLYQLVVQVFVGDNAVDTETVSFGFRHTQWTADDGFFLNGEHFEWRGFCNHNDFTGVGVAVPERINLFRAQMLKSVGGNSWRMSHNPPIPTLLDILDRLGVVVWDENRQFGKSDVWIKAQQDMVRRDRNHPSVAIWSFCNEWGCTPFGEAEAGREFKAVTNKEDPLRLVGANMIFEGSLTGVIDVQGYSHRNDLTFDLFHDTHPGKPLIGSECCSCRTQRGEDVASLLTPNFANFNADCLKEQISWETSRRFLSGALVWTLFDYYGEPTPYKWPMVSSSFGAFDLAGFPKAACYWYRSWWLLNKLNSSANSSLSIDIPSRAPTFSKDSSSESRNVLAYVVQGWEDGEEPRTVQGYTSAPYAELFVNGQTAGRVNVSELGWAEWVGVKYVPGEITMNALSSTGEVVAVHKVMTSGMIVAVVLSLDAPSVMTGTGTSLVLDGQDAALVRATIVDGNGQTVRSASQNVTFSILSGPGRIIGVGNGNPSCHEPNKATWRSAYHGLARAVVQVTEDHASHPDHRRRMIEIDIDGGHRTKVIDPDIKIKKGHDVIDDVIVVEVSVEGVGAAQLPIPVSSDLSNGVMQTAERWMA